MNSIENENPKQFDYLKVLKALDSMPFSIGKNLLIDFLHGDEKNESIKRNRLNKKILFGILQLYSRQEINDFIENLLHNSLLEYRQLESNRFVKVLSITEKGRQELLSPVLHKKKLSNNFAIKETAITEQDRMLFESFDFFLKPYNDEQKKAIVSPARKILCVAGAGSGKTTVLTKRIEFLAKFRSAAPERILAVTFTRKARSEMAARLSKYPNCNGARIETFNSFCEQLLKLHNDAVYSRPVRIISYSEKIRLFNAALKENKIDIGNAVEQYFSFGQIRGKTPDELARMLMNDCYSILELYKTHGKKLKEFLAEGEALEQKDRNNVEMIYNICSYITSFMEKFGLRDYSDQLIHCMEFLKNNPDKIPKFDHILVDEYQDVNAMQIGLIDLLDPENLFCVGDPRQSIFGWRGSKIKYILNFEDKYPDSEIITLSTNYRSSRQIVDFMNRSLENARLPELRHSSGSPAEIKLINFDSENEEIEFVVAKILELSLPRNEIFVLARTNRLIKEVSDRMKLRNISHIVRTEDHNRDIEAARDEVTLATVHSIKGLEASAVFVIGCTGINFPCKASDHPIIELVRLDDYDKEEEERRLFYVAVSRAKNSLYLTYSGKSHTRFISERMLELLKDGVLKPEIKLENHYAKTQKSNDNDADILSRLKMWRTDLSRSLNLPAYIIMHDKTLLEIASARPSTLDELGKISGIGSTKLRTYGNDILNIVLSNK
ncbi:UvrD-helicase domain-containing protein [Candidatus Woesearchaeota archaeon]|nr:UvrD-helicase domain-containing protein [Candidatus Woesearchaeota archaeon]